MAVSSPACFRLWAQIASLGVGSGMLGNDLALKANLLNDLGQLWLNPRVHPDTKREMAREIFEEVRVEKGEIVAVRPREAYMPLMASSWEALCRGERSPVDSTHLEIVGVEEVIKFWDKQARSA